MSEKLKTFGYGETPREHGPSGYGHNNPETPADPMFPPGEQQLPDLTQADLSGPLLNPGEVDDMLAGFQEKVPSTENPPSSPSSASGKAA